MHFNSIIIDCCGQFECTPHRLESSLHSSFPFMAHTYYVFRTFAISRNYSR